MLTILIFFFRFTENDKAINPRWKYGHQVWLRSQCQGRERTIERRRIRAWPGNNRSRVSSEKTRREEALLSLLENLILIFKLILILETSTYSSTSSFILILVFVRLNLLVLFIIRPSTTSSLLPSTYRVQLLGFFSPIFISISKILSFRPHP